MGSLCGKLWPVFPISFFLPTTLTGPDVSSEDPQSSMLHTALVRLAQVLGQDFLPYFRILAPIFFQTLRQEVKMIITEGWCVPAMEFGLLFPLFSSGVQMTCSVLHFFAIFLLSEILWALKWMSESKGGRSLMSPCLNACNPQRTKRRPRDLKGGTLSNLISRESERRCVFVSSPVSFSGVFFSVCAPVARMYTLVAVTML